MIKNIDIAFAERISSSEKRKLARSSLASFLETIIEFIFSRYFYPASTVRFENEEMFHRLLAEGRGVYGLALHQGNWELLCHKGSRALAPVHMALKPVGGPAVASWVRATRERNGVYEIPRKGEKPAWQIIYDVLHRKEIVAFVVDQRRSKGVKVPLFGRECMTNASLFRQWRGFHSPIVPVSIRRIGLLSHEARFWEPFEVLENEAWSEEEFLKANATKMNRLVEEMILWNPAEYFWMHDRFKMR